MQKTVTYYIKYTFKDGFSIFETTADYINERRVYIKIGDIIDYTRSWSLIPPNVITKDKEICVSIDILTPEEVKQELFLEHI